MAKSISFFPDEAAVHLGDPGHAAEPLLAVEQLEQLPRPETLLAGVALRAQEVGRRRLLPVYCWKTRGKFVVLDELVVDG